MAITTKDVIQGWLGEMRKQGATHMIVVYDSWDREDFPVYIANGEDVRKREAELRAGLSIMEVYSAKLTDEEQLAQHRAFNYD